MSDLLITFWILEFSICGMFAKYLFSSLDEYIGFSGKEQSLKGDINIFFFMICWNFIVNKYFMKELWINVCLTSHRIMIFESLLGA